MSLLVDQILDVSYWAKINPHLTISKNPKFTPILNIKPDHLNDISDKIHHDGYIHEGPLFDLASIQPLRQGIETLVSLGWPAAFIYVYDEAWDIFQKLEGMLSHFLGDNFGLLPHFWAWHIDADDNGTTSGWPPHMDYSGECAFFDDYLISLSLWIPLTDATSENGCMSILPLSRQKTYEKPVTEVADILLQDVRSLPAKAGSLLGWRQDLWHWSGRSSKYAKEPRISLSLEFQNRAFDPLCPPLFDLKSPPEPEMRLRLICGQFEKYVHMEQVSSFLGAAAKEIGLTRS